MTGDTSESRTEQKGLDEAVKIHSGECRNCGADLTKAAEKIVADVCVDGEVWGHTVLIGCRGCKHLLDHPGVHVWREAVAVGDGAVRKEEGCGQ